RLRAGDQLRAPIQLINTTAEPITAELLLETTGLTLTGPATTTVTIPANGSVLRFATLSATRPGQARLRARLGETDAVIRTIDIEPTGQPQTRTRSGTLAAPRQFALAIPAGDGRTPARVRLQVFPGALAILRSELLSAGGRGGVADDAFALLLAGTAPAMLRALGDDPDQSESDGEALRALTLRTAQRVIRHARTLDANSATLLARAALTHADNPVLERIGRRAVAYLAANQAPDGTCGGETGWTLQRLLVATADCARAAADERAVVIRASGAFERHTEHVRDAYTAAAILASDATASNLSQVLRERVRVAIDKRADGTAALPVPADVVRADGQVPSEVEATALAILALDGDDQAPLADLGAT
ncbi:MAG: hypothetical protein AAGC55_33345, partial [Myxococcota bacterium]